MKKHFLTLLAISLTFQKNIAGVIAEPHEYFIAAAVTQAEIAADRSATQRREAQLFSVRLPEPLSQEEQQKHPLERVKEKYAKVLPRELVRFISHHTYREATAHIKFSPRLLLHGENEADGVRLSKILAQELQLPSLSIHSRDIYDIYLGEEGQKIRKAFATVKDLEQPVLLVIVHVDELAQEPLAKSALRTELDAIDENRNVFVIMTATDITDLDAGFLDRFGGRMCSLKDEVGNEFPAWLMYASTI